MELIEGATLAKRFELKSYEIEVTLKADYFRHVGIAKEKKIGQ